MRWGGYPRISDDKHDTSAGVDRQTDDITVGIEDRGAAAADIAWYPENNTSAYKRRRVKKTDALGNEYWGYRVIRPVWHQALHDLRTGVIEALMVWDLDRLARDPRDLEDAIEVVQYYGKRIEGAKRGQIDLTTDAGIAMARVITAMNAKSSADTSRRVARVHLQNAKDGVPMSKDRPFGWQSNRIDLDPVEAQLVRDAVADIMNGASLSSIARRWVEAGIMTTAGNPWRANTLRQYLRNPRLTGIRRYQRKVMIGDDGLPVRGIWTPLLSQDEHDRLLVVLDRKAAPHRERASRTGVRSYLLTGLIRCWCSAPMYGAPNKSGYIYTCNKSTGPERHTNSINGKSTEDLAVKYYLAKVSGPLEPTAAASGFAGDARLAVVTRKINELMDQFMDDKLSGEVAMPRVAKLEAEKRELQAERALWITTTAGPTVKRMTEAEWEALAADAQRAHLSQVLSAVVVRPRTSPRPTFDRGRVVPVPREDSQSAHAASA